jgi:hypothetical protein
MVEEWSAQEECGQDAGFPRHRHKRLALVGFGSVCLIGMLASGCGTVSEKQRLTARLHHQCITRHFDRIESAATLGGSSLALHRACANWSWKQVRALPD